MSFDMITSTINSANAVSIGDELSAAVSKMAFRILYEASDAAGGIPVRVRMPYIDKSRPYNSDFDFMPHETSPIIDCLVPAGFRYGIITFKASGKEGPKKMVEHVRFLRKKGWATPDGERFCCVYAHISGDAGFMLFVSAASGIRTPEQLGLILASSAKAPKRVKRALASYMFMFEAELLTSYKVETGTVYEALLPNGKVFRALDFDMSLLDAGLTALVDGSGHCSLPGFDGCAFTMLGTWGSNKGVYACNPLIQDYDVVNYGSKSELSISNGRIFIGALSQTGLHELWMDSQTLLNSGGYEDHLCVRYGMDLINKMSAMAFSDNEEPLVDYFAKLVNISDEARLMLDTPSIEWSMVRAMKLCHESKTQPVFFRREYLAIMKFAFDVVKGRVFVEDGCRVYARPYPNMFHSNGMPDRKLDNLSGKRNGLPMVSMPDLKEGEALVLRNPNTHKGEMILVWNTRPPELAQYKGQGWCFFGSDAGELLSQLNGGDMDDSLAVITDPAFIAKWLTMEYPVQPKIKVPDRRTPADIASYRERLLGIGKNWSFKVFEAQLDRFTEYADSLGSFINDGMLDTSLSGEHKTTILGCLVDGRFVVPENFQAPTRRQLEDLLLDSLWRHIPADYEPDLDHFVQLCIIILEQKPDFICAHAMSNSDLVIDMLQQGAGDRNMVSGLIAEAKEARKTLFFPVYYEGRMPRDRVKAGNYILVETKMCRALNLLTARHNEVIETSRQIEHLLKRQLHPRLLAAYPADENIMCQVKQLKFWWMEQFRAGKAVFGKNLPKDFYKMASKGYDLSEQAIVNGKEVEKIVRVPGLWDLYHFSSSNEDGTQGAPLTVETRRRIGINWLASVYTRKDIVPAIGPDGFTQSVGDGVPNFILDDILSAEEELGLTGLRVFVKLNAYAKSKLRKQVDKLAVFAVGGEVFHCSNSRILTETPDANLPDGNYMMSPKGVITVRTSAPELHSAYQAFMATIDLDAFEEN